MHDQSHTLIGVTKTAAYFLYAVLAIIGLTIGYFIPQFVKWALSLPWIPFEGPLRLVTSFQAAAFITALLGMSPGICFAHSVIAMLLSVQITDDTVELTKGKKVQTIRSDNIALVFIDHKRLVPLGTAGYEIAREEIDEKPETSRRPLDIIITNGQQMVIRLKGNFAGGYRMHQTNQTSRQAPMLY